MSVNSTIQGLSQMVPVNEKVPKHSKQGLLFFSGVNKYYVSVIFQ